MALTAVTAVINAKNIGRPLRVDEALRTVDAWEPAAWMLQAMVPLKKRSVRIPLQIQTGEENKPRATMGSVHPLIKKRGRRRLAESCKVECQPRWPWGRIFGTYGG